METTLITTKLPPFCSKVIFWVKSLAQMAKPILQSRQSPIKIWFDVPPWGDPTLHLLQGNFCQNMYWLHLIEKDLYSVTQIPRDWSVITKFWDWAKYHNRHSSKSIRVTNLSFCQNDSPMSTPFWQKKRLVTLILFELCLLWYLAQSQILVISLFIHISKPVMDGFTLWQLIYMIYLYLNNLFIISQLWSNKNSRVKIQ